MRKIWILFLLSFGSTLVLADQIHVVQKNETLGGIAKKYGVSTGALQAFNGIANPNLLFVGKKLKIPQNGQSEVSYVVKKGDSLGSIASRFKVKLSTLALLNKIDRPDLIKVGQKIIIPVKGTVYSPPRSLLSASTLQSLSSIRPHSSKWQRIVSHHSATPVDDAMNMHRVHKARGMKNGLAYHFVISNGSRKAYDGEIYIGGRWRAQLDGGHMKKKKLESNEHWNLFNRKFRTPLSHGKTIVCSRRTL